jgi:putative ABC transport system permease protein
MPDWSRHLESLLVSSELDPAALAQVKEELSEHLNYRYHALLSEGALPRDAEQQVLAELQQGDLLAELTRVLRRHVPAGDDSGSAGWMSGLWRDLRYALRQLRLSPGFAVAALLSLALGIGANTAIFEMLDAVRMRMLPVRHPEQLADIRFTPGASRTGSFHAVPNLSLPLWEHIRDTQQAFSATAAWTADTFDLNQSGEVRYGRVMLASGGLFELLGLKPELGRFVLPTDDQRGCSAAPAVVSYAYWQREMGGRVSAIGERVWVERHSFEVIGVAPQSFFGLEVGRQFNIALPVCAEPIIMGEHSLTNRADGWWLAMLGRLKPGVSLPQASAQLTAMSPAITQATMPARYNAGMRKDYAALRLVALPADTGYSRLRDAYDRPLWLLLGISGLVLLIACANLANLMLARAAAREREMAVRLALGASRGRLLRQLLAESMLLATIGATCGAALAQVLSRFVAPLLGPQQAHIFLDLHLDWRVLGFTAGLAILTCVVFGLSPALQASRVAPADAMKTGGRGVVAGQSRFGLRRVLVVSQIALSLMLVFGALLFVRTFHNLVKLDPGFDTQHILNAAVDFSSLKISPDARGAFRQRIAAEVASIPGVDSVAISLYLPMNGGAWNEEINIPKASTAKGLSWFNRVGPNYFATLETPVLAGREFTAHDDLSAPLVAIVNQTFARRLFHDPTPLGQTFGVMQYGDKPDVIYQVVGVVKDTKYGDLREDSLAIAYVPMDQDKEPAAEAIILARSAQSANVLLPEIRQHLLAMNPSLVLQLSRMKDDIADGLVKERLMAMLAGFFGALAIILAVVGLYGVIAFMVARRTNEIGIRIALGAKAQDIARMVLVEVAVIAGIGIAVGIALALAAAPAARALLFGLQPSDPQSFVLAIAAVLGISALASMAPALRAAHLDPLAALREE